MPAEKIRMVTKSRTRAAKTDQTSRSTTATRITRTKTIIKSIIKITTGTKIMEALIHSNERLDDLCRKGYRLIQDPKLFCFGIDAVLLSDYAKVKRGERAVDLCTGNGVIPILLEAKNNGEHYSGLELQPQCADLAKRSVKYNHLEDKVTIEEGDVCNASEIFGRESVEVVTVNPPYMIGQHGIKNADDAMTIARHEVRCTLDDIVRESAKMLKFNGRFYMVHRPFRLAEI